VTDSGTCVVFGGRGFLGQSLCRKLLGLGLRVRSISPSGQPSGDPEPWWSDVEWVEASLGSKLSASALEGTQFVFHLASTTVPSSSNTDIAYDLESNVLATVRTLEAAASTGVHRVVFVSSGGTVYGIAKEDAITEDHATEPICSHGIHKLMIEKYLHLFRVMKGLDSIVLRVSNMYGESQSCNKPLGAVAHFTARAVNGRPIELWGDGSTTRDYVHVDDVASALAIAVRYEGAERIFNIGTGRGTSLNDLIDMLRKRMARPIVVESRQARSFDVPKNVLSIGRARRELLWNPEIALESGLDRVVQRAQMKVAAHV